MNPERKPVTNLRHGGPRSAAGKSKASRNALRHGLASTTHRPPELAAEIEYLAKALRGDDGDLALFNQASVIAKNVLMLQRIREQQVAEIDSLRESAAHAPAKGDHGSPIEQQQHEAEDLEQAIPNLIRLERYERRTWSQQRRAIYEFMNIALLRKIARPPSADDAESVEQSFRAKLTGLAPDPAEVAEPLVKTDQAPTLTEPPANRPKKRMRSKPVDRAIDKSALALPEPRRIRDRDHVRYVATQPCLVCGRQPSDGHHLRFAQSRALGRKVSDEFTVPLCRGHHREVHRRGDEAAWWKAAGLDPTLAARVLWLETHPLPAVPGEIREEASIATLGIDERKANRHRPNSRRSPNYKTKPNSAAGQQ